MGVWLICRVMSHRMRSVIGWPSFLLRIVPLKRKMLERANGIHFYNDSSRPDMGTGLGYFSSEVRVRMCSQLPQRNTFFLSEGGCEVLSFSELRARCDGSESLKTRTFLNCKKEINVNFGRGRLCLVWVPGHSNLEQTTIGSP